MTAPFYLCEQLEDGNEAFNCFQDIFCNFVNKHAPLKCKTIRANNKPLSKVHRKAIMIRTKLKNIYNKCKTDVNFEIFKKQRNHCANLRQRVKSDYLTKICQNGILDSKTFWKKLKPYFFSKGHGDSEITISENDRLVTDPQSVAEIMNNHFVSIGNTTNPLHNDLDAHASITEIIRYFQEHSSIRKIKRSLVNNSTLSFKPIPREGLRQIIVNLNHKKANGHDMINAKFLKISVDIILEPLLNIMNKCILQGIFPESLRKAIVSPIYKKKDPFNKENYRPISLLTTFSKIFEKAIELQLSPFLEEKFSKY